MYYILITIKVNTVHWLLRTYSWSNHPRTDAVTEVCSCGPIELYQGKFMFDY